jgi:fructose-1,6-bisphosphatase/inositol monophosphatase family enzyme
MSAAQAAVLEVLAPTFKAYDLGLLTEELADDGSRFEKDYFWSIDPLDGTLPFTQGKPGYAVSIALVRRGTKRWHGRSCSLQAKL